MLDMKEPHRMDEILYGRSKISRKANLHFYLTMPVNLPIRKKVQ